MYQTLQVTRNNAATLVTINRPQRRNSINSLLLEEIQNLLNACEQDSSCRFIVFQGQDGYFCTGMDFEEVAQNADSFSGGNFNFSEYMALLKRFTNTSKVIISLVDGHVMAGGVGIVAASDLVISSHRSQFSLSEALWGLLPACVTPFLIRRIGFQKAYTMTLTTETISAEKAHTMGLIDQLSDNPTDALRQLLVRLSRIEEETVKDLKSYFHKMWIINEAMEATAVAEITRLINEPRVQENIKNFVNHQRFPWDKARELV